MTDITAGTPQPCQALNWQVTQMIRLTENTRARLMIFHGFAMLALGLGLLYIRATMSNLFFYVFGGAFALLLVAASLLFIAGIDWLCAVGLGRRQLSETPRPSILEYSRSCLQVFLVLYPGATIQMLCYVLAVYALSLSVGKFGLARSWNRLQAATNGDVHPSRGLRSLSVLHWSDLPARMIERLWPWLPAIPYSWVFRCCSRCTFCKSTHLKRPKRLQDSIKHMCEAH